MSRTRSGGTIPSAATTATAIGRSNPLPFLGIDAGDRLTVIRSWASDRPMLAAAALTRLGDCAQAVSGNPPSMNAGRPPDRCASTSTTAPARPSSVTDRVRPKVMPRPPARA